ncbi:MAG: TRAP transporter small permease [Synergistaceae bacterium]|jgi:TRAP-type C4-dicarboxylate transport system permease small subunit|nr:TRAP transporter small permease [Synergistaceae bacterium]
MFRKVETTVSMFVEQLGMFLLVLMVLVVCLTVVTRYFFSYTPSWSEETALLCMVWFGFLSMALGVRDDLHLSITILDRVTPKFMMTPVALFKYLCTFGFGAFMLIQGLTMATVGLRNKFPGLGLSSAWLYSAVPLSGCAVMIYSVEKFFLILMGKTGKNDAGEAV